MRKKTLFPPVRKNSFLFLETMIALGVVALCLCPLLLSFASIQKANRQQIDLPHSYLLASLAKLEIKHQLYENQIPWAPLKKKYKSSVEIDEGSNKKITVPFIIEKLKIYHKKESGVTHKFLHLSLTIEALHIPYHFDLFIEGNTDFS